MFVRRYLPRYPLGLRYQAWISLRARVSVLWNVKEALISQPPPASIEDMNIYLNDFEDDEIPVLQLYSPVLGWSPPDGSKDVDIGHEDLTCPAQIANSA